MPAPKGYRPPAAGKGRVKGTRNKVTKALKVMILEALDKAGGVEYLLKQAKNKPVAFMNLLGKVMPLQITGPGGGPVLVDVAVREAEARTIIERAFGADAAPVLLALRDERNIPTLDELDKPLH